MVPSDDRLNSKFSIVSFVASEGANYNEDEPTRSRMTDSGLLLLNQTRKVHSTLVCLRSYHNTQARSRHWC